MDAQQAGESVRGFAWLVSLAFCVFVGYLLGLRGKEREYARGWNRRDETAAQQIEAVKVRCVQLIARTWAADLRAAGKPTAETADAADAWLHEQQGEAG